MLPNQNILDQVNQKIKFISNKRGEYLHKIHYCCYLLGYKSGLRISEAINFDLANQTKNGLYRITKTKGKMERLVYVPKQVINELKENNWKPCQTNRHNFYHFLQKIKQELKISKKIELTPHTLRRSFTTRHANSGMPLPLLQKMLGHSSPRTTALYWKNIHGDGNDIADILAGKKWLENKKAPPRSPNMENFSWKSSKISFATSKKLVISSPKPIVKESSLPVSQKPKLLFACQPKSLENQIPTKEKVFLDNRQAAKINEQLPLINNQGEKLNEKRSFVGDQKEVILLVKINHLEEQLRKTATERDNFKIEKEKAEAIVVTEKQTNSKLCQQLQTEKEINLNLTQKINHCEQNHTNLINDYQNALKDKQTAEKITQTEKQNSFTQKQRIDYYEQQLKIIAKILYQRQKINYYRQLEKEQRELKAQIVQPPPRKHWKN